MADKRKDTQQGYDFGEDENMNTDSDSEDGVSMSLKDIQDLDILTAQSNGQLILVLGYFLEYIASQQAIEFIKLKYAQERYDKAQGIEIDEEEEEEIEEGWKNAGLDADKTEYLAAFLELYGQTVLTRLDYVKYQRFSENTDDKDYTLSKTANWEIYVGAMLEELAYIFNFQGVQKLYYVSNQNPVDD